MPAAHDEWLVRTTQNVIAGPYSQSQVLALIEDRKLGHQDEVCAASGYWFYLHERDEVKKQLGIELPPEKSESTEEEITETQTDVGGTDPAIQLVAPPPQGQVSPSAPKPMPALSTVDTSEPESRIEGQSVVRGFVWFLVLLTAAVVYATFKATKS